jgi:hypothetical protein
MLPIGILRLASKQCVLCRGQDKKYKGKAVQRINFKYLLAVGKKTMFPEVESLDVIGTKVLKVFHLEQKWVETGL